MKPPKLEELVRAGWQKADSKNVSAHDVERDSKDITAMSMRKPIDGVRIVDTNKIDANIPTKEEPHAIDESIVQEKDDQIEDLKKELEKRLLPISVFNQGQMRR